MARKYRIVRCAGEGCPALFSPQYRTWYGKWVNLHKEIKYHSNIGAINSINADIASREVYKLGS